MNQTCYKNEDDYSDEIFSHDCFFIVCLSPTTRTRLKKLVELVLCFERKVNCVTHFLFVVFHSSVTEVKVAVVTVVNDCNCVATTNPEPGLKSHLKQKVGSV